MVELDDEVDSIVKSMEETGCPVPQWCERMLVGGGLTRFFPVRAEMSKWSEIRMGRRRPVWPKYNDEHR